MSTASRSPNQRLAVIFGAGSWIVPIAMSLVLTPVIVRGLGVSAYGVYALVLGFLNNTFTSGLGRGVVRECSGDRFMANRLSRWLSAALTMAGVIGVVAGGLLALAAFGSVSSLRGPGSDAVARLAALAVGLAFPLVAIQQVLQSVPLAGFRFDVYAQGLLLFSLLQTGGTAFLATRGVGPPALVLWYGLAAGVVAAFLFLRMRRLAPSLRISPGFDHETLVALASFGGPVFVYQLAGYLQLVFERWWLGRSLGAESVTLYVIPMALALQLHAGVSFMARGLLPAVAATGSGAPHKLIELYEGALGSVAPPLAVAVVALVALRHEVLGFWMGPRFRGAPADAMGLLAVSFGVLALLIVPWEFAEARNEQRLNAIFGTTWLAAGVAADVLLVGRVGVIGAALARASLILLAPVYVVVVEKRVLGEARTRLWRRVGALIVLFGGAAWCVGFVPSLFGGTIVGLLVALCAAGMLFLLAVATSQRRWVGKPR